MILATILTVSALATTNGATCAAINNASNTAVWVTPSGQVRMSTYSENGRIVYRDAPGPRDVASWRALHAAERALLAAPTGPKVKIACRK
jgi:hypothetical protein